MKTVAKNQNVRSTRCGPMMLSSSPYRPWTSHSSRFCAPFGTWCMFAVAIRAKTMRRKCDDPRHDHRVRDWKPEGTDNFDGRL